MKKSITILAALILLLVTFIVYFLSQNHTNVIPPKRLANIPQQAEWVGGVDGGIWYQVTKIISRKTFKIKIYNDVNGELEIDTTFILNPDCAFREIDSGMLIKSINGYDGESIILNLPEKG